MARAAFETQETTIGAYQVVERLASGRVVDVFRAKRAAPGGFERNVVIKRVRPEQANDESLRRVFVDEARVMARLRHPNIAGVHELGSDGDSLYVVMDSLRGCSLARVARDLEASHTWVSYEIAVHIAIELCAALQAVDDLRARAIELFDGVARNISPANVFITTEGEIKLLDLGYLRSMEQSSRSITDEPDCRYAYIAPELLEGADSDRRSEVFAVGVILHELLTGRRLFARATTIATMQALLGIAIPKPSEWAEQWAVPGVLDSLCLKALARDPSQRFESAAAMRRALRALLPAIDPAQSAHDQLIDLMRHMPLARTGDRLTAAGVGLPAEAPSTEVISGEHDLPTLAAPSAASADEPQATVGDGARTASIDAAGPFAAENPLDGAGAFDLARAVVSETGAVVSETGAVVSETGVAADESRMAAPAEYLTPAQLAMRDVAPSAEDADLLAELADAANAAPVSLTGTLESEDGATVGRPDRRRKRARRGARAAIRTQSAPPVLFDVLPPVPATARVSDWYAQKTIAARPAVLAAQAWDERLAILSRAGVGVLVVLAVLTLAFGVLSTIASH